jgi:Glycosyl transferase family 2
MQPGKLQNRPKVSVVVPCYNYERYLADAVASVLTQEDVDVEVIIVDDASADGSPQLALALAEADTRVQAVLHPQNMGHIATYNDGLSRVTGDYVVLLSADDLLAPDALARSTALMEQHPEVGLVYGYAEEFSDVPPPSPSTRSTWSVWSGEQWLGHLCRRGANIIVNPEAVVRRSVMDALVGYRSDMPHAADMDLWMRAASLGSVGRINGPVQAFYRVHGHNMHLTDFSSTLDDIRARRDVFDALASLPGPALSRPRQLARAARRAIAVEAVRAAVLLADTRQDGPSRAAELADFALETDASVTRSAKWKAYLRHRDGRSFPGERAISSFADHWRWSLRWRRWRRTGI